MPVSEADFRVGIQQFGGPSQCSGGQPVIGRQQDGVIAVRPVEQPLVVRCDVPPVGRVRQDLHARVAGGDVKLPKPSSTRLGATASCVVLVFCSAAGSATAVVPVSATIRLSMSTNEPDSGKSDQRVSPVT